MASKAKQEMVQGATLLLAKYGLQATSFAEVLALTHAPRGSIYYHFPEGKDQLVGAAMELAGRRATDALNARKGSSALELVDYFLQMWREVLVRSNFTAGCAVLAVTIATDSLELLDQAATIFRTWRVRLAYLLEQGGLAPKDAAHLAILLVASAEGAVVLARAEQSMEPFELVAEQLRAQAQAMTGRIKT